MLSLHHSYRLTQAARSYGAVVIQVMTCGHASASARARRLRLNITVGRGNGTCREAWITDVRGDLYLDFGRVAKAND